jgi:multidrug resistance efflux pump
MEADPLKRPCSTARVRNDFSWSGGADRRGGRPLLRLAGCGERNIHTRCAAARPRTRIDIAARVSGRLAKISVVRGQDVAACTTLLVIDNPELVAQLREAEADKTVADAELARINVGTRTEIVAQRKAEIDRAMADLTLAQQTSNRTKQLAAANFARLSKLDQDTDALTLALKRLDQANLAYQEAVRDFTAEDTRLPRRMSTNQRRRSRRSGPLWIR